MSDQKLCGARHTEHTRYTLQKKLPPVTAVCDLFEHKLDLHIDSREHLAWGKDKNVRTDYDRAFRDLVHDEEKVLRKRGVGFMDAHQLAKTHAREQLGERP